MIIYLRIKNFGIFDDVNLELAPGLTVFTGETGAGKSMLVDAVMACLGYRTSSDTIRTGKDRAVLELLISPPKSVLSDISHLVDIPRDEPQIMLQRDILPERSYMRINGKIATMSMAQSIGKYLVDIHGQQAHHSLLRPQNNLSMLDEMSREIKPIRSKYQTAFIKREKLLTKAKELRRDVSKRMREIDLLSYQIDEIDKAELRPEEEGQLRQKHKVLVSQRDLIGLVKEIYGKLYEGPGRLQSAYEQITESVLLAKKIKNIDPSAENIVKSIEKVAFSLEIVLDQLRDYQRNLSLDPSELRRIEDRLDLIEILKTKYGGSIDQILEYKEASSARLSKLLNADEMLKTIQSKLNQIEHEMKISGMQLSKIRSETSIETEKNVTSVLKELGMPSSRFVVVMKYQPDNEFGIDVNGEKISSFVDGFDKAEFLFSANPGEPPLPIHKVASGGELSRLMLAVKSCMKEIAVIPTLIFDEIDSGVGGKAGQTIGEKLWQISQKHQVLCVTHLASIAAMADTHFVVTKHERDGKTYAEVAEVSADHRAREIARMLSGTEKGVSLDHGRELIVAARNKKTRKI